MDIKRKSILRTISGVFTFFIIWWGLMLFAFVAPKSEFPLVYFENTTLNSLFKLAKREILSNLQVSAVFEVNPNYSKLDGSIISVSEEIPVAIMIDNHPDARLKHCGIGSAGIVYETLAEGAITRFLAVFSYQDLSRIGPVRSARLYFVRWAQEYNGGYGHAGGSPEALDLIPTTDLINLEGLYYEEIAGGNFFRDNIYFAPHNLFADLNKVRELTKEKKTDGVLKSGRFLFADIANLSELQDVKNIKINFSSVLFQVQYDYDVDGNRYLRTMGGKSHVDTCLGEIISPSNVIVQFTDYYAYDEKGRRKMKVEGEGNAIVFTRGKVINAVWRKVGNDFTRFYDSESKEIPLASGQTWIEVVKEGAVEYE